MPLAVHDSSAIELRLLAPRDGTSNKVNKKAPKKTGTQILSGVECRLGVGGVGLLMTHFSIWALWALRLNSAGLAALRRRR